MKHGVTDWLGRQREHRDNGDYTWHKEHGRHRDKTKILETTEKTDMINTKSENIKGKKKQKTQTLGPQT